MATPNDELRDHLIQSGLARKAALKPTKSDADLQAEDQINIAASEYEDPAVQQNVQDARHLTPTGVDRQIQRNNYLISQPDVDAGVKAQLIQSTEGLNAVRPYSEQLAQAATTQPIVDAEVRQAPPFGDGPMGDDIVDNKPLEDVSDQPLTFQNLALPTMESARSNIDLYLYGSPELQVTEAEQREEAKRLQSIEVAQKLGIPNLIAKDMSPEDVFEKYREQARDRDPDHWSRIALGISPELRPALKGLLGHIGIDDGDDSLGATYERIEGGQGTPIDYARVAEQAVYDERAMSMEGLPVDLTFYEKLEYAKKNPDWSDWFWDRMVPYVSQAHEAAGLFALGESYKRINNGSGSDYDQWRVAQHLGEGFRMEEGGLGEKVIDVLSRMPAFMVEFGTSGGITRSITGTGTSAIRTLIARGIHKTLRTKLLKKAVSGTLRRNLTAMVRRTMPGPVDVAVQTMFNPQLVINRVADNLTDGYITHTDFDVKTGDLKAILSDEDDDFESALIKGFGDAAIEMFSERTGFAAGRLLGATKAGQFLDRMWNKIPWQSRKAGLKAALMARGSGNGVAPMARLLKRAGWNGYFEEMMEERIGDTARWLTGIQDSPLPSLEQLKVEAIAFSVVPGAQLALGAVRTNRSMKAIEEGLRERTEELRAVVSEAGNIKNLSNDELQQALVQVESGQAPANIAPDITSEDILNQDTGWDHVPNSGVETQEEADVFRNVMANRELELGDRFHFSTYELESGGYGVAMKAKSVEQSALEQGDAPDGLREPSQIEGREPSEQIGTGEEAGDGEEQAALSPSGQLKTGEGQRRRIPRDEGGVRGTEPDVARETREGEPQAVEPAAQIAIAEDADLIRRWTEGMGREPSLEEATRLLNGDQARAQAALAASQEEPVVPPADVAQDAHKLQRWVALMGRVPTLEEATLMLYRDEARAKEALAELELQKTVAGLEELAPEEGARGAVALPGPRGQASRGQAAKEILERQEAEGAEETRPVREEGEIEGEGAEPVRGVPSVVEGEEEEIPVEEEEEVILPPTVAEEGKPRPAPVGLSPVPPAGRVEVAEPKELTEQQKTAAAEVERSRKIRTDVVGRRVAKEMQGNYEPFEDKPGGTVTLKTGHSLIFGGDTGLAVGSDAYLESLVPAIAKQAQDLSDRGDDSLLEGMNQGYVDAFGQRFRIPKTVEEAQNLTPAELNYWQSQFTQTGLVQKNAAGEVELYLRAGAESGLRLHEYVHAMVRLGVITEQEVGRAAAYLNRKLGRKSTNKKDAEEDLAYGIQYLKEKPPSAIRKTITKVRAYVRRMVGAVREANGMEIGATVVDDIMNGRVFRSNSTGKSEMQSKSDVKQSASLQPNDNVRSLAKQYMDLVGVKGTTREGVYASIDPEFSRRAATAYEGMQHDPRNPEVQKSYKALADEVIAQYQFLESNGVVFEIWNQPGQPYSNSRELLDDVRDNNHLWFFPTDSGFGEEGYMTDQRHPMLAETNIKIGDQSLLVNDVFRAVHDYFGHAKEGYQFGPRGEENAWIVHSQMFTPEARMAMGQETRGQNSWVNFGKHIVRDDGSVPVKGDPDWIHPADRPYAEQKAGVFPAEFHEVGEQQKLGLETKPIKERVATAPLEEGKPEIGVSRQKNFDPATWAKREAELGTHRRQLSEYFSQNLHLGTDPQTIDGNMADAKLVAQGLKISQNQARKQQARINGEPIPEEGPMPIGQGSEQKLGLEVIDVPNYAGGKKGITTWVNPAPTDIVLMLKRSAGNYLRGIVDGDDLIFWDGLDAIHDQMKRGLNIKELKPEELLEAGVLENGKVVIYSPYKLKLLDQRRLNRMGHVDLNTMDPLTAADQKLINRAKFKEGETITDRVIVRKAGLSPKNKELKSMYQKALDEILNGKPATVGRPDLANPGDNEDARARLRAIDEHRKSKLGEEYRPVDQVAAEAKARMEADGFDRDAEAKRLAELARTNQPMNDVDVVVAQKIYNEVAQEALENGDEASFQEAIEVGEAYRKTMGSIARALSMGKSMYETKEDRMRGFVQTQMTALTPGERKKLDDLDAQINAAETEEARLRILLGKRRKIIKNAAARIRKLKKKIEEILGKPFSEVTNEELNDLRLLNKTLRAISTTKSSKFDMVFEYWMNSILSGLTTQQANIMGNFGFAAWENSVQRLTEIFVNAVLPGAKTDAARFGELKYILKGLIPNLMQSSQNAWASFWGAHDVFAEEISGSKIERVNRQVAIPGAIGSIIRTPTRMLTAMDNFFKTWVTQTHASVLAYRKAADAGFKGDDLAREMQTMLADPDSPIWDEAHEEARRLTFQNDPGKFANTILQLRAKYPLAQFILPFVTTPVNIFKTGIKKTPLGSLRLLYRGAKGEYRGSRDSLVRDLSEQILSWSMFFMLLGWTEPDDETGLPRITGSRPVDYGEAQARENVAPATSIRIFGRWINYNRIEPFAVALATTVDSINAFRVAKDQGEAVKALSTGWATLVNQIEDKTFLRGVSDIAKAMSEPERRFPSWVVNFGTSWVPNIVRSIGREGDEDIRDQRFYGDLNEAFWVRAKTIAGYKALPGILSPPPARVNYWGEPIARQGPGLGPKTDWLYRATIPIRIKEVDLSFTRQLDRMILNYNNANPMNGFNPRQPYPTFEHASRRFIIEDPALYQEFLAESGQMAAKHLERIHNNIPLNFDKPGEREIKILKSVTTRARTAAKNKLIVTKLRPLLSEGRVAIRRGEKALPGTVPVR